MTCSLEIDQNSTLSRAITPSYAVNDSISTFAMLNIEIGYSELYF